MSLMQVFLLSFWQVQPNVPADTLQEAMDYACGEGGADCEEIMPHGNCFYPDTVVAHASYAFNSYWQKTKRNGGTCAFGGTAMLINADPMSCRLSYHMDMMHKINWLLQTILFLQFGT
ncbi:glucan endo-1,3-beta-D-glucosidase [Citrus sinensis]|uniref:Glucan endo-1,3-beta-D-glucosidase n=1 Tax=Citrus sinensis TaxID=2711 RepID=A0ACB8J3G7_CITSI|nr:glucan endo-1,3-beta-D-glucosidase [Citrus sinensis]